MKRTHSFPGAQENGFTYVMVLVAIVVIGILVEVATLLTSRTAQAEREAELLYRGQAYQRAIKSYYAAGKSFPRSLDDLLKDPRSASKRHIRALYPDPVAKGESKDWLLIRARDGGIAGVASASKDEPMKKANFPKDFEKFEAAKTYSDWVFEYVPSIVPVAVTPAAPATAPTTPAVLKTN
jgi:type II secretory pathway pseudopilin PulG